MQFRGSVKRALYEELARRQDALCWANRFIPCSAASADMWSCTGKQVAPEANLRQDKRLAVGRLGRWWSRLRRSSPEMCRLSW